MPRLKKGDLAPGIARLREESTDTVRVKIEKWTLFLQSGSQCSADIPVHFRSLSAFAEWEDDYQGISSVDPKTLRKNLRKLYPGGSEALSTEMRSLRTGGPPADSSRSEDQAHPDEQPLQDAIMEATNRYIDLLERFKRQAERDSRVMSDLERHMRLHGPRLRRVK